MPRADAACAARVGIITAIPYRLRHSRSRAASRWAAVLFAAAASLARVTLGGVSDAEAERLARDLTPLGAERAGDGGIPEWSGGLTSPAVAGFPDYRPGEHLKDPYESEQPMFVISAANVDAYAAQLSAAHQVLLRAYPDYRMLVYRSHRSAAAPEEIYRATRRIATTAHLVGGGNGVGGAFGGIPFPIPGSGLEVLWNHLARFRGTGVALATGQAAVNDSGAFTLVRFREEFYFPYYQPAMTAATSDNILYYFMQTALVPARLNGETLLVQQTLDQAREPRRAWVYVPAQRRVRRAPQGTYLNPELSGSDLRSADQFDMYSGSPRPTSGRSSARRPSTSPTTPTACRARRCATRICCGRITSTPSTRATSCTGSGWWMGSASRVRTRSTAAAPCTWTRTPGRS